jgi:hypothetical protein
MVQGPKSDQFTVKDQASQLISRCPNELYRNLNAINGIECLSNYRHPSRPRLFSHEDIAIFKSLYHGTLQ